MIRSIIRIGSRVRRRTPSGILEIVEPEQIVRERCIHFGRISPRTQMSSGSPVRLPSLTSGRGLLL
jgi:hypothetical protein